MALFVSEAGTVVPAGGARLTRRDVLAGAAVGVLAAGAPRLARCPASPGGLLTEPTAGAQTWRQEPLFVPPFRHWPTPPGSPREG